MQLAVRREVPDCWWFLKNYSSSDPGAYTIQSIEYTSIQLLCHINIRKELTNHCTGREHLTVLKTGKLKPIIVSDILIFLHIIC